jgi:SSS family transporter
MNNTLEYSVIGIYLVLLIVIGLIFRSFNKNVSDYFRGGCRGTWWLVGVSSFIAGISAYTFTGAAGAVYDAGWSVLVIYFGNALGFLINYFYFAARFRQLRKTTGQEVIRDRFDQFTEQFYSWISFPSGILGSAMLLYSLAIFISSVFGFNMQLLIIVVGLVVVCYSIVGGRWAIMATDFVQCLIVMGLTLLVGVLCLIKLNGFAGLFAQIDSCGLTADYAIINSPEKFDGSFTWFWAGAMLLNISLTNNSLGAATRYFSVKDGKEAKKAAMLACILMVGGCIIWFLPPMTARIFYSDSVTQMTQLSNPKEAAFAITCMNLLPPGMIGLMAVAMFAASISSLDTGLNGCSSVFIMNIYPVLAKAFKIKALSESTMLKLSRLFTFFFGVLCIVVALLFSLKSKLSLFDLMLTVIALLGTPMTVPLVWGMVLRRCPKWAALSSIICGFLVSAIAFFSPDIFGVKWPFAWQITGVYLGGTLGFLVSIFWVGENSEEYNKQVDDFFELMNRPIDFEKEIGEANDNRQLKLIGSVAMVLGLLIALLAIPAKDVFGVICPLSLMLFMLICGGLMYFAGSRSPKSQPAAVKAPTNAEPALD